VPFAVRRRRLLGGALAALAAGCAPVSLINRLTPTDTYRREPGLAYGPHARQRLDAYLPAAGASRAPVVLFFYGGAWRSGDRADYLFVGEALASRGIVALVADYRLYPEVRFPAFVADAALAAAWAVTHAAQFGADPGRLLVMGHSAGAYNAAMIALDRSYLAAADADPAAIRGLIGLAGPYDFLPLSSPLLRAIFGYPETSPATQPIHFVRPDAPPALLLTARHDRVVDPGNSARLAARLRAAGAEAQTATYDHLDHRTLIGALAAPLRRTAPVLADVVAFVQAPAAPLPL
jgi:acetyl esterase/lipase